jgi:outer membrane protein assembly factor BamB
MRTHYWTLCGAIVVWTCIGTDFVVGQAKKSDGPKGVAATKAKAGPATSSVESASGTRSQKGKTGEGPKKTDVDVQRLPRPESGTNATALIDEVKSVAAIDPLDWTMWRGPEQNGISRERGLVDRFNPTTKENVLWFNEEAGGISTPVIMNGRLYTMVRHEPETKREQEKVLCLDATTGKKIWESRHNVYLSGVPAERVGWSCVAADPTSGRVYAQGVNGLFKCLDAETGKEIWSRSLHEQHGLLSTYGGRTNTPVVFEDLIIAHSVVVGWGDTAIPAHRFIAMDKNTGEIRWFNGTGLRPEDTTFATPVLTVLGGQAAMVFGSCDGSVWAFQPRTGKPLWNYRMSRRGINTTPVVQDDMVYISQAEETLDNRTMGSVAAIDGLGSGDMTAKNSKGWLVKGITAGKASPLLVDGRLYIADDGANLYILDAKTGKRLTPRPTKLLGTMLSSSPVWADGKIYVMSTGAINVLQPTEAGVKSLFKSRLNTEDIIIGSPAISHGRIYLPLPTGLYCLGKEGQEPQADEHPAPLQEKPAGADDKPAWVQVVPCEVLMKPGEKQQFTVRLFNERGQFLKESEAEFSVAGKGEIAGGEFTAPAGNEHSAVIVTAKVGELSGKARIRVVPPLPWKFDFDSIQLSQDQKTKRVEGEPPLSWVGARYRHKIRDVDGERVMVKVTYIPKGTRSQMWMGHDDLSNYTIQADLRGQRAREIKPPVEGQPAVPQPSFSNQPPEPLPDMGLIAQRYTIDMLGASQALQIRSWPPQVRTRFSKTIPFQWKPDVWYTVKFQASAEGSGDGARAVLRGKVWPRGDKEPAEWTIEAVDEVPNLVGSPGLYGDATNAEVYIDNITVTPNEESAISAANPKSAVQR